MDPKLWVLLGFLSVAQQRILLALPPSLSNSCSPTPASPPVVKRRHLPTNYMSLQAHFLRLPLPLPVHSQPSSLLKTEVRYVTPRLQWPHLTQDKVSVHRVPCHLSSGLSVLVSQHFTLFTGSSDTSHTFSWLVEEPSSACCLLPGTFFSLPPQWLVPSFQVSTQMAPHT